MRIFSARRSAWSSRTTRRPRCPATLAHIMPAAPAPMTATSNIIGMRRWANTPSVFDQAVDVVALGTIRTGFFGQPVDVRLEAGIALVELAGELQILHDGAVETLARDQQRNARRIRGKQYARDAALGLVDLDALDLAVRHAGEGVGRLERGHHVAEVHLGSQARHILVAIGFVYLLAQVAQAHA